MGEFPFIDVPITGGGIVIALISLVHVVLAHFAVGTGILIYGFERADASGKDPGIQRMLKLLGLSVIYISFVIGAITGVGIWFAISLFSADATQHLIQKFVWLWATEWSCFAVEICVGYLYYYRRQHLTWKARKSLAGIYMAASWGSLLVITGILSYMLTSRSGNAIVAWLNPSVWPSVGMRTLSSLTLACMVVLVLVNIRPWFPYARESEERLAVQKVVYKYLFWFFLLLPMALWYRLAIPVAHAQYAEGSSIPISMFLGSAALFSALVTGIAWFAYKYERRLQLEATVLILIMAILATFSAEFVREGIRKPYIIYPILYSNGMWVEETPEWQRLSAETGSVLLVEQLYPGTDKARGVGDWFMAPGERAEIYATLSDTQRGEAIFRAQCIICHTWNGFNGLDALTLAWDNRPYAREVVRTLNDARPYMPPFVGSDQDVDDLITYLQSLREEPGHDPR